MGWTAVSLWFSFRQIDRIEVDISGAREAISNLSDDERPPPPPVEIYPDLAEPTEGGAPPATDSPQNGTRAPVAAPSDDPTSELREGIPIEDGGEVLPYDAAFARSAPIPDEVFNAFLIIGSDKGGLRADVIILALLPDNGSAPILVSLPRDLWLESPCWDRPRRINTALNGCGSAASGPELLALTVAEFTGIEPDHFALFDFRDFKRVIDAFGGVEICVRYPVRDGALDLPAGCTMADGEIALAWVRSRKTEEFVEGEWRRMRGVNDLTRNSRQRDVLLQLLGKGKSFDALTSLTNIGSSIANAVTIDSGMTVGRAVGLVWGLRSVPLGDIAEVTIPVEDYRTAGGAAVLIPTESFADTFAEVWP